MLTGRKPNLSKMWVFGSECYTYNMLPLFEIDVTMTKLKNTPCFQKLDPRGERGIFVGHSKNSPAYLIYNPHRKSAG